MRGRVVTVALVSHRPVFISSVFYNKHWAEKDFTFCMKAVGFIYLMSTNLFISKKKPFNRNFQRILLSFLFLNRATILLHRTKLEEHALPLI